MLRLLHLTIVSLSTHTKSTYVFSASVCLILPHSSMSSSTIAHSLCMGKQKPECTLQLTPSSIKNQETNFAQGKPNFSLLPQLNDCLGYYLDIPFKNSLCNINEFPAQFHLPRKSQILSYYWVRHFPFFSHLTLKLLIFKKQ